MRMPTTHVAMTKRSTMLGIDLKWRHVDFVNVICFRSFNLMYLFVHSVKAAPKRVRRTSERELATASVSARCITTGASDHARISPADLVYFVHDVHGTNKKAEGAPQYAPTQRVVSLWKAHPLHHIDTVAPDTLVTVQLDKGVVTGTA